MSDKEIWRTVPGMDGVLASSHGRILMPPRYAPIMRGAGYRAYMTEPRFGCVARAKAGAQHEYLNITHREKTYKVHQLVCAAFHGPKPFQKAVVIHLDENALNNRAGNLKWGTQKENLNAQKLLAAKRKAPLVKTCGHCGGEFRRRDHRQTYCGLSCAAQANANKKRAA